VPSWSKNPGDRHPVGRGVLRKHTKGRVWYFHFKDEHGEWRSVSTGHRDKAGAVEFATAKSLEMTRREHGIVPDDAEITNDTIVSASDEWLGYVKKSLKPDTHKTYRSVIGNLKKFFNDRTRVRRLEQFDKTVAMAFRDWLIDGDRTKKTADNNLIALRAFFNWCIELGKMRSNPIRERKMGIRLFFNDDSKRRHAYTTDEYDAIVDHAQPDMALRFRFLANTGLRIGELAALEWADVDLQGWWVHVRAKTTCDGFEWSPKDRTDRRIPIEGDLRELVVNLKVAANGPLAGYVFPGQEGQNRIKNFARTTLNRLKDVSEPAGIDEADLLLHNFRHYFVSQCADCGIDMACVMEWLGHDDLTMVLHYYRLRDEHARAAMRRFTTGNSDRHEARPPRQAVGHKLGQRFVSSTWRSNRS